MCKEYSSSTPAVPVYSKKKDSDKSIKACLNALNALQPANMAQNSKRYPRGMEREEAEDFLEYELYEDDALSVDDEDDGLDDPARPRPFEPTRRYRFVRQ